MVEILHKEDCCGCGGCANICQHDAISMISDNEGFLYPSVNADKCVGCNLCEMVCPFRKIDLTKEPLDVLAVKNRDENIRLLSSSGGVFTSLMNYIIQRGGAVYGAAFDSDFNVVHTKSEDIKRCERYRGAKYVQSNTGYIYRDVLAELKKGREVLFSGTPCQVATLLKMVGKKHENLVTSDVLCHGVPSPKIWRDYLSTLSQKPTFISFRDKSNGWHSSSLYINAGEQKLVCESHALNDYSQFYFRHLSLRESCAKCPYAKVNRCGDFSIGDFWGIENTDAIFDDNKGVSLVFVNTKKAQSILSEINDQLIVKSKTIDESLQPILENPSELPSNSKLFWMCYRWLGFNKTKTIFLERYTPGLLTRVEYKIVKRLYKYKSKLGL